MEVIKINKLSKTYNDTGIPVHAVNAVDLTFEEGEFAAIVGPSGSGKTTLLNMLGGLDRPSEGEIIINNTNISDLYAKPIVDQSQVNAFRRFWIKLIYFIPNFIRNARMERKLIRFRLQNIGFIFQAYNLIPVLTAEENVDFIMNLQGWTKEKRKNRTSELLNAVGLGERVKSRPARLSGGQQQRVAVARALASKPKFILADEPTANLDSKSTANLLDIMQKLNKEENITFIFATHDQRVVDKARRVIKVEDGKIISDERQ